MKPNQPPSLPSNLITNPFPLGPVHFTHNNHSYFYSDRLPEYNKKKYDWLEARNECREYCMDLVSIETPSEDDMIRQFIIEGQ